MTSLVVAEALRLPGRLVETSLVLRGGELVCLIGPNGSGKTSLLHALAGIGSPGGKVSIDGVDPFDVGRAQRRALLSYLPASREVAWPLAAADLIALGAPEGQNRGATEAVLDQLELGGMASRRVDRMSTGERSRVLIARALIARSKLLLLDEPIANLDPRWQLKLMEMLRRNTRANRQAVLLAVHDLDIACAYADRLIIMENGRIAADGEPAGLVDGPLVPQIFGIERIGAHWRPLDS